jgi:uncharacterized membrane protein (UPF0127 family)
VVDRLTSGHPPLLRWAEDPAVLRWALRGVALLLLVAVGAWLAVGADRPANPSLLPNADRAGLTGHSSRTSRVPGFGQIGFRVEEARSTSRVAPLHCALLADQAPARARGMAGRRDFGGYAAMVFRYTADSTAPLSARAAGIPLSVAWFDAAGVLIGTADLPVCRATCPALAPVTAYRLALEVARGGLHPLGVGSGSVLLVGGNCGA